MPDRDLSSILDLSSEQIDFKQLKKRVLQNSLEKEWKKATNLASDS